MAKGSYTESDAWTIFCQIVSGLSYLHSRCEQNPRPAGAHAGRSASMMLGEQSVWWCNVPTAAWRCLPKPLEG